MNLLSKTLVLATLTLGFTATTQAQLQWQPYRGATPANAVMGGYENGRQLAISRMQYNGGLHPGKLHANMCHIGWGGREVFSRNFEILTHDGSTQLTWERAAGESLPADAVVGGWENGSPLYIGKADYNGGTHCGKVFTANGDLICNFGWGGREIIEKRNFLILVSRPIPQPQRATYRPVRYDNAPRTPRNQPAQQPQPQARLRWERFRGAAPANAVMGGYENGRQLAICRMQYNGGLHPGKLHANMCHIGWGGREVYSRDFEVLVIDGCSSQLAWVRASGENIPANAVVGGRENGKPLYIGKADYNGGTHCGKVFTANGDLICNFGWGGREIIEKSDFYVLVRR